MKGEPDQNLKIYIYQQQEKMREEQAYLYTSMRMYIPDKSRNAMLPVAMTNDTDQRFLLMGMTPVF